MRRYSKTCVVVFDIALLLSLGAVACADEMQGKLTAVYPGKNEFMLTDGSGKTLAFKFAPDCKVLINDKAAKLEDLLAGEQVSVVFERPMDMPEATLIRCKRN